MGKSTTTGSRSCPSPMLTPSPLPPHAVRVKQVKTAVHVGKRSARARGHPLRLRYVSSPIFHTPVLECFFRDAQVHARSSRKSRACACQANANSRPPGISPCVEKRHACRSCTQVMCNSGGDAPRVPLTRSHKDRRSPQEGTRTSSRRQPAEASDPTFTAKLSSTDTVVGPPRQAERHSKQQLDCVRRLSLQKQRQALDIFTIRWRFFDLPYHVVLSIFFLSTFPPAAVAGTALASATLRQRRVARTT